MDEGVTDNRTAAAKRILTYSALNRVVHAPAMRSIKMSQEGLLAVLILMAFVLQACIIVVDPDDDGSIFHDDEDLSGSRWRLERIVFGGRSHAITDGGAYTLRFDNDGELSGRADCNSYGAEYRFSRSNTLSILDFYATEVACERTSLENEYFDNLLDTGSYEIRRDELVLYDRDGDLLLQFYED